MSETKKRKTAQEDEPAAAAAAAAEQESTEEDAGDDCFDLEEWGAGLQSIFEHKWKTKERVVSAVPLSKEAFATTRKERSLEDWCCGLSISGDEQDVEAFGGRMCGPGASFGGSDCKGAAEFLLQHAHMAEENQLLLHVSVWDKFNVDLADIWDDLECMLDTAETELGAIPGPWTAHRLEKVLQKIYDDMRTEPPDEPEYLHSDTDVPKICDVEKRLRRIELQLQA